MILLSSGCTVLDLALGGGFPLGKIVNICGKEAVGKSLIASECIYTNKIKYKNKLKWRYNEPENKYAFDSLSLYGFAILNDEASDSIEEFDLDLLDHLRELKKNEKLIYILDSLDSISTDEEIAYYERKRKAKKEGRKFDEGTYGMSKPKELGAFFRLQNKAISDKNCLLMIISQVRTKIGVLYGAKETRTGGRALDHQASQIIWLKEIERYIKQDRIIGVCIKAKVTKNDIGKPFRECYFDLLFDYGIDNVSSNINFLYDLKTKEGKSKKKEDIVWDEKEFTKQALIKHIESNNLEEELDKRVITKWNEIEEAISPKNRKGKEKCEKQS